MAKKKSAAKRGRPATGVTPMRYFRMADGDYDQVLAAAKISSKTPSDWIRTTLLDAAKKERGK